MYVDLHIHTTGSDGTWDVDELYERIGQQQITLFSITDHDRIENSLLMQQRQAQRQLNGVRFVIGAEISSTYQEQVYHITAYHFDPTNPALRQLIDANAAAFLAFNEESITLLSRRDARVDMRKYAAYEYDRKRGGFKALHFLLDEGIVQNNAEFFDLLQTLECRMIYREPAQVIQTIRQAGGWPFLAHPHAYYQGTVMPETELRRWIAWGIAGLECYSPYCGAPEWAYYVNLCRTYNLRISAGSDCHGDFLPNRQLGQPRVTADMLNLGFVDD